MSPRSRHLANILEGQLREAASTLRLLSLDPDCPRGTVELIRSLVLQASSAVELALDLPPPSPMPPTTR